LPSRAIKTLNVVLAALALSPALSAQHVIESLPDSPSAVLASAAVASEPILLAESSSPSKLNLDPNAALFPGESSSLLDPAQQAAALPQDSQHPKDLRLDENGNPIPLNKQQPQRILGFMPNFRSVSAGAKPHPPGWNYNFKIATRQAFDYSSFIFLGITTISAEGINSHPVLGKGADGFYAYLWRGMLDKTDGTYLAAWLLPSLLHEDTRYYPLGAGHSVFVRSLYVISRQGVARTYGGRQTPNIAGLGAKVLTQVISRTYYPTGATSFGVLATKFGYSAMRDVGFSSIREFYPDVAAHYIRKHREKAAAMAAHDANASGITPYARP
jgi:hypothetical protein